jgi:hypothetical protein
MYSQASFSYLPPVEPLAQGSRDPADTPPSTLVQPPANFGFKRQKRPAPHRRTLVVEPVSPERTHRTTRSKRGIEPRNYKE